MTNESREDYCRRQATIRRLPPIVRMVLAIPVWFVWLLIPFHIWYEWKIFSHLCHHFDYR